MNEKVIFSLFILGVSFGAGPCLASCGALLISYIVGSGKNVSRAIGAYLLFSTARILVYLALSVSIFFLNIVLLERFLGNFSRLIYVAGGIFIVLVGLVMIFFKKPQIPCFKTNAFILGIIIGLIPCAGLLSALTYIGLASKSLFSSVIYGLSFGIGTVVSPLLILVIFAGAGKQFILSKKPFYGRVFNFICGLIIIYLGVQLLKNA